MLLFWSSAGIGVLVCWHNWGCCGWCHGFGCSSCCYSWSVVGAVNTFGIVIDVVFSAVWCHSVTAFLGLLPVIFLPRCQCCWYKYESISVYSHLSIYISIYQVIH